MRVQDLMTLDVKTCRPHDSTSDAARLMWEHDCGIIPVVDDEQRPVGMISDRDVCMAGYTTGRTLAQIAVGEVMSREVLSCLPDDPISVAEQRMSDRHVRRLPVVDPAGRLVGIVSLNDLALAAARSGTAPVPGLALADVGQTLAAVSRPWRAIYAQPMDAAHAAPSAFALMSVPTTAS